MDWYKKYKKFLKEDEGMTLENALEILLHYIRDNNYEGDMNEIARVLRANGYEETRGSGTYYRGIFHEITPDDKRYYNTVSDFHDSLKAKPRFKMSGTQGFTTSVESVRDFIKGQLHYMINDLEDFIHDGSTPLDNLDDVIIVYAVEIPANNILWSMNGLKKFLENSPKSITAKQLHYVLTDIWDGYGNDDEVFAEVENTKIKEILLYEHD